MLITSCYIYRVYNILYIISIYMCVFIYVYVYMYLCMHVVFVIESIYVCMLFLLLKVFI